MPQKSLPPKKSSVLLWPIPPGIDRSYLKKFVHTHSGKELGQFLHLVTGANVIAVNNIRADLNSDMGAKRSPKFHTCSLMIELPATYETFNDISYPVFAPVWTTILVRCAISVHQTSTDMYFISSLELPHLQNLFLLL